MKELIKVEAMTLPYMIEILRDVEPTSFQDIVNSKSPSFKAITHFHGKETTRALILVSISEISKLLSFAITTEMLIESAKNIEIEFYDCKIDDMAFFKSKLMRNQLNIDLYRNDALVMFKIFQEYYVQREDVFAEAREQRRIAQRNEENVGFKNLYDNAPQWYKDSMDRIAEKMRIKNEEDVTIIPVQNMLLEEICYIHKIPHNQVAQKILYVAEQEYAINEDKTLTFDFFKTVVYGKVLYEARKDPESLRKFIETI